MCGNSKPEKRGRFVLKLTKKRHPYKQALLRRFVLRRRERAAGLDFFIDRGAVRILRGVEQRHRNCLQVALCSLQMDAQVAFGSVVMCVVVIAWRGAVRFVL